MCTNILLTCMFVYQMHFGNEVMDSCEVPCVFWELNLGPLQEQMLLSMEPFLWPSTFPISQVAMKRK